MVFSSMTFLPLFLPAIFILYFLCRNLRVKNALLLVFSLVFYGWGEPVWIFIMMLSVLANYICGLLIHRSHSQGERRAYMVTGVALSLGCLFLLKYFGFCSDTVCGLLGIENPLVKPVLPIGLSFYTFQIITYVVDVYRGKVPVQENYFDLLLYVAFFPQLIAGPIVNYTDIAASLQNRRSTLEGVYQGLLRFCIGLAKKAVLANSCGAIIDKLLDFGPLSVAGSWLMALCYAFQIYFDFSGYSDMAIGMGRIFGFRFLENFNYPYISRSVTEFWRRWHISLGTFFRDYVYIPMGGNRVGIVKHIRNIFVVWFLTGFWHGASWNFIAWGVYYGVLLLLEKYLLHGIKEKLPGVLNVLTTLLAVLVGWVLFYYVDLGDALSHLKTMFGFGGAALTDPAAIYYFKHNLVVLAAAALACIPWKAVLALLPQKAVRAAAYWLKPVAVTVLLLLSVALIVGQSYNPFLYFRF